MAVGFVTGGSQACEGWEKTLLEQNRRAGQRADSSN
jgi:hypothetical protein